MSWFPVHDALLDDQRFRKLAPTYRVLMLHLISEYNLRGAFYEADELLALRLRVSVKTIRRVRKELAAQGWIEYQSGFRDARGRGMATEYRYVALARPESGFVQMPRHVWRLLLWLLTEGLIGPSAVLLYVYLFRGRLRTGSPESYVIGKRVLEEEVGLSDSRVPLRELAFCKYGKAKNHLFKINGCHRLVLSRWSFPKDPDDSEDERWEQDRFESRLRERLRNSRLQSAQKGPRPVRQGAGR